MASTIKLRGHHLLCLLAYRGEGYTPDFIANFDAIADRLTRGAIIEIISGPDQICGALRQGAVIACDHARICRKQTVRHRDRLALKDIARALHRTGLKEGDRLSLTKSKTRHLRQLFAHGGIRRACSSCPWYSFCTQIAADKYRGVKLLP
jgi:hypothetical protein